MVSRVLLRKLRRELMRRKFSIIVLVLIVMIGIGGFIGYSAIYRDLDSTRRDYYAKYRLADFTVSLKRAPDWAIDKVTNLSNVRSVEGRVAMPIFFDLPERSEPVSGMAISYPVDRQPKLNDLYFTSGIRLSELAEKEVVIDEQFAKANGLKPGHRIKVVLLEEQHEFLVVGTALSPEFVYVIPPGSSLYPDPARYGIIYLPLTFMQEKCDLAGAYNQILGSVHDRSMIAVKNTLLSIENELDSYGVLATSPYWEQASVKIVEDELKQLKVSAVVIPMLFLGVSILVLNILIGRMVRQQRTVIGTLRSLGYTRGSVMLHYLGYGMILGTLGGLAGAAFGRWLQVQTLSLYAMFFAMPGIHARVYTDVFVLGFLISITSAVLGTLKGVYYASKLEPAESMRPPTPEKGGSVIPERITFFWNRISFRWKIILRAIFRNPFRSSVSVISGIISTALVFMMLGMMDGLNYMIYHEFSKVSHEDYSISLREPKSRSAMYELGSLPFVSKVEPQLAVACHFSRGSLRKSAAVIGLTQDSILFTPLDSSGNRVVIPRKGLVLSRKLAEILGVRAGDELLMRLLMAKRTTLTVPVVAVVDTYLGLSAFADIDYLSHLLGEEAVSNSLLCNIYKGVPGSSLFEEMKKRPGVIAIGERYRSLNHFKETYGGMMLVSIIILVMFAGLIAFGSVLNITLVSLSERQVEIGTLRVLGYTTRQVASIFSRESFFLNSIGIVLGLFAGIGFNYMMSAQFNTELYRFPVVIKISSLALSAALMMLFVSIAQVFVYKMVSSLEWLTVLKTRE